MHTTPVEHCRYVTGCERRLLFSRDGVAHTAASVSTSRGRPDAQAGGPDAPRLHSVHAHAFGLEVTINRAHLDALEAVRVRGAQS
jgi:hypothetical protein